MDAEKSRFTKRKIRDYESRLSAMDQPQRSLLAHIYEAKINDLYGQLNIPRPARQAQQEGPPEAQRQADRERFAGEAFGNSPFEGGINVKELPLSLGIETLGGIFTRMINGKTSIPTKKSQVFSTASDNQTQVTIKVLLGESERAVNNKRLGEFDLVGIPPAPRGLPQIEVTFDIDANGIVTVSAKDKATGKEHHITLGSSGGLSDDEINRMVKEAEQKNQLFELRNTADTKIYSVDKTLGEYRDKIPAEIAFEIQTAVHNLRTAMAGEVMEYIKAKLQAVNKALSKIGEHMSKGSDSSGSSGSSGREGSSGTEQTHVAEFEETSGSRHCQNQTLH